MPSNPDSDRLLTDVSQRALPLGRGLRCHLGNFMRVRRGAIRIAEIGDR